MSGPSNLLSADEYHRMVAAGMSEEVFLQQLRAKAHGNGWATRHERQTAQCPQCHGPCFCARGCRIRDGRPQRGVAMGTDAGWPDLVLCKPPKLIYAELKSETGRLTPQQRVWLTMLGECGQEWYVWRPRDMDDIAEVLEG